MDDGMEQICKESERRNWEIAQMRGMADELIGLAEHLKEGLERRGLKLKDADAAVQEQYRRLVEAAAAAISSCYGKKFY